LDRAVRELRTTLSSTTETAAGRTIVPAPAASTPHTAPPPTVPEAVPHVVSSTQAPPVPEPIRPLTKPEEPVAPPPIPSPPVAPPFATPSFSSARVTPHAAEKFALEEKVGTNWFSKIGTVLVVLGVAFLISTLMKTLGPAGKVLLGIAVGGALLAAGAFFERLERYKIMARAAIGGGWALLFFTAYAMHHVAAARVIESQTLGLFLMMAVAAAMVWHTLPYNSQVVTGLAFLLAFATVNIGRGTVFSLTAGVVLAAALAVFVVRKRWFELEVFAILATYLNHWFWLRPIIEPMAGRHHAFPQFIASALILCSYWLIFRFSYIVRSTEGDEQESISTVAALLNGGLLLAVMRYQSVRPELAFWFLLGLGFAELLLGQLPVTRRRRAAFVVLTVIGSALIVAAIPFRYSGVSLAVLWIAEAQALLMAGMGTDEPVFRRLGLLAMAPPAAVLVFHDAARAAIGPEPKTALVCAFAAFACYVDVEFFQRRWPRLFEEIYEGAYIEGLSYAGMILAVVAVWAGLHDAWVGTVWATMGFALAYLGNRLKAANLEAQANILAAAALVRVFTVNVEITGQFHAIGLRLLTVSCVAGLLYLSAPWTAVERRGRVPSVYTWAASFLVALLAWYELRPVSVALAWALFGVLLLELGLLRRMRDLTGQAMAALAAAFTRIFFVNLNASASPGQVSPRVYTVIPLALIFYYAYERLRNSAANDGDAVPEWLRQFGAPALCWFGAVAIAALMRFELNVDWVIAAWAAGAMALLLAAYVLKRRIFLHQAIAATTAVFFRGVLHNFYEHSYFAGHWSAASKAVIVASALLLASLPIAFLLRDRLEDSRDPNGTWLERVFLLIERHPHQFLFFVPLALVTVLLAIELRSGMITVAWGIEGVIVFVAALLAGERSYRLAGVGLLLLCVGKILVIDVWRMQGTDRYLTLIVTGSALLLVSFLYSRYREAVRQYL
ncbi:MAG: DUF2339 domain-containing protein, partial [Terriglobales bacterium]